MAGASDRNTGVPFYTSATSYWLKQPWTKEAGVGGSILGALCILTTVSTTLAMFDVATSASATLASNAGVIFQNMALPAATTNPVYLPVPAEFSNGCFVSGGGGVSKITWFYR